MFEIPLFLLFLQIGFNAALNNRAYSKNQQILHNKHSDNSDLGYRWGVNDENSDSEYDSSQSDEEYDFKSFDRQRRNDLRYKTRPNLETAVERINANNYANVSSSSLRSHPNYRRPYSGPLGLRQEQALKFHRKENEDSQTSLEGSKYKHASRLEEQPSSLESLSPLFEQFNNRRGQNHRGNRYSDDASPLDKFYAAFRSNSQNKRRNYRKEYSNNNLNTRKSSDGLSLGLKPGLKSYKLKNNRPLKRGVEKYKLFPNEDDTNVQLTFLRESSLEDVNLESPSLRSRDQDIPNNRKSNSKNYLTFSLSPNNKDFSKLLTDTLDELYLVPINFRRTGSSSNKFNRRENYNLSAEEDNLSNLSDTSLESSDIPNTEIPLLRSSEPAHKEIKRNLKQHMINQKALKELVDDDKAKVLVPYHEGKSKINSSDTEYLRHDIQHPGDYILRPDTNKSVKGPASLELRSKSQQRVPEDKDNNEHATDVLPLEYPLIETQNSSKKQNKTKLRSHDKNEHDKNTTDVLPLEHLWIDTLSSKKKENNTKIRSYGQNESFEETTNVLPLQYPWIDSLSSEKMQNNTKFRRHDQNGSNENTRDVLPLKYQWIDTLSSKKMQNNTKFRRHDQNGSNENTRDVLPLEYPWIDTLSFKRKKNKSILRSHDKTVKDSTDVLPLQWNDALKNNGSIRQKDRLGDKKPKRMSRLDKLFSKKAKVTTPEPISVHPNLRNRKNKHSDNFRRSYDRFNDGLRLQHILDTPRSNRRVEVIQNLEVLPIAKESENHKPKNFNHNEGSSAVITFPSDRSAKRSRLRRVKDSPPLLITTGRPNHN